MRKLLIVAAAFGFLVCALPAVAQQPAAPQPMTATGALLRVDTTAHTITIKGPGDGQLKFSYSDQTQVSGDEKTVAGLATLSGTDVRVTYTKQGQDNMATEIFVQKKPA